MDYIIVTLLIALSALFSGLTLGLMGLNVYDLERKMNHGDKLALKVYPLRQKGNLLLTALLLGNVFVNSVLAIFLGSIASGVVAGIMATALIFIFGEIIPQAVISRHALRFGAIAAPFVQLLIFVLYPIIYPIAYMLDKGLGEELPTVYTHRELISIIAEHEDSSNSPIDEDEERIAHGALKFSHKKVEEVMTPRTVVVDVHEDDEVNEKFLKRLINSGQSRFPVHEGATGEKITGLLNIRTFIGKELSGTVKDIDLHDAYEVSEDDQLDEVLNSFIRKRQHLFVVKDEFGGFAGVVTVEDILEEILGKEIVDEFDKHRDMRTLARAKKINGDV